MLEAPKQLNGGAIRLPTRRQDRPDRDCLVLPIARSVVASGLCGAAAHGVELKLDNGPNDYTSTSTWVWMRFCTTE
jgi:hypothetical protein